MTGIIIALEIEKVTAICRHGEGGFKYLQPFLAKPGRHDVRIGDLFTC